MIRAAAQGYLRLMDAVNAMAKALLALLLLWMTFATFTQVLIRFVFTHFGLSMSAPWTEELARYAMIWVVFIGVGVGFRYGLLLSLSFVVNALGKYSGQALRYLALLMSLGFLALLFQLGLRFVEFGQIERSPALSLQKTWVYWAMPVGSVLGCANILAVMIDTWCRGADIRDTSMSNDEGTAP